MCQQVMQFCSGSTKPLLFVGGLLSLLLAIAIGYTGCTTNALFSDIDPQVASAHSLSYFLQLAAAGYLILITLFSCHAAYYDQKHSIRALAFISCLNMILAVVAIMMIPSGQDVSKLFKSRLNLTLNEYDFADKGEVKLNLAGKGEPAAMNSTAAAVNKQKRWTLEEEKVAAVAAAAAGQPVRELNQTSATLLWDQLQARGCCGINNATEDWKSLLPKSCCAQPVTANDKKFCKEADAAHQQGCLALIGSTSLNLLIVLALIAVVNFYLALITGISAYRTFHYDEANQNAYS